MGIQSFIFNAFGILPEKRLKNNILIIEIGGSHVECVHTLLYLLHLKHNKVYLICNEKLMNSVVEKDKLAGILIVPNKFSRWQQFSIFLKIRKYINQHGIGTVIFNTTEITPVRDLLLFLPKMNCVGIVHNAAKLEKNSTLTRLMSWRIKKILLLSNYLLQQTKSLSIFKVSSFFPMYFPYRGSLEIEKPDGELWVVVPGWADESRRDYAELITTLKQCTLPTSLRYIFLGPYNLDNVVSQETKNSDWWKKYFIVFNDYVDYDTFHAYMKKADAILPLLKKEDNFYGHSRISGAFNLGLAYKLPFLLPKTYRQNTDLQPYSLYYKDIKELTEVLINFNSQYKKEQSDIAYQYKNNPLGNLEKMADKVCDFIFEK